jgi:ATP-dependent exoDNAse (exonuclease V) beta subunit
VAAGTPTRQIMVLCRKRQPLGELQAELRHLGIACEQPEAQNLGDLPVAQDVLALVDALVSPGHDLSLARALKSPCSACPTRTWRASPWPRAPPRRGRRAPGLARRATEYGADRA